MKGTALVRSVLSRLQRGLMWVRHRTASVNEALIIMMGNQKSGTSAIAHLLGRLRRTLQNGRYSAPVGIPRPRRDARPSLFRQIVNEYPYFFSTDLFKEPMMTFFSE